MPRWLRYLWDGSIAVICLLFTTAATINLFAGRPWLDQACASVLAFWYLNAHRNRRKWYERSVELSLLNANLREDLRRLRPPHVRAFGRAVVTPDDTSER